MIKEVLTLIYVNKTFQSLYKITI